ncbi:permease [Microbacterium sp. PRF11]|uniref:permease n=1 Tax=Microbacterium sp. PRF11 TaxID=2962593 RepID=UPI002882929D|nr:permease [Microbacterium sp. PRF11]MDT0117066.1 permease [Microbacterium sp. PRF11]
MTSSRTAAPARRPAPAPPPRPAVSRPLVVCALLLAAAVVVRVVTIGADSPLPSALSDGITLAASVVVESLPFVFLGVVISIAVQLWVPTRVMDAIVPRRGILRRAVLSLLGVILPVCECGNVPLARGLMMRGFSVADSVTFLLAAPILNPITLVTTYQAFGWSDGILVSRLVGGFVIANLVGWLVSLHPDPARLLTPAWAAACASSVDERSRPSLRRAASLFRDEISAMLPALFLGAAIAGLIQVAVSRETLVGVGGHPVYGVLALIALAFVIAICSNVDAFFALSLASSFSPGALIAFLVFGPMIDVKMLAMLSTTFRARALAVVTLIVALGAAVLGLGVNLLA